MEAYATLLALVAIGRLFELVTSKRRIAGLSLDAFTFDERGNWPAMVVLHVLLLVLPLGEVFLRGELLVPLLFWPCIVAVLASTFVRLWTQRSLGPAWNARGIVDPQLGFETGGPYKYMRHPNYLAVAIEVVALPLAGSAFVSIALLLPAHLYVLLRRVRAEDKAMETLPGYTQAFADRGGLLPRFGLPS